MPGLKGLGLAWALEPSQFDIPPMSCKWLCGSGAIEPTGNIQWPTPDARKARLRVRISMSTDFFDNPRFSLGELILSGTNSFAISETTRRIIETWATPRANRPAYGQLRKQAPQAVTYSNLCLCSGRGWALFQDFLVVSLLPRLGKRSGRLGAPPTPLVSHEGARHSMHGPSSIQCAVQQRRGWGH